MDQLYRHNRLQLPPWLPSTVTHGSRSPIPDPTLLVLLYSVYPVELLAVWDPGPEYA